MAARKIRVSSRAMGQRRHVTVMIYDTVDQLHAAAHLYNGADLSDGCVGSCQATCLADTHQACSVIVRLAKDYLGTRVVSHEMLHAATAIYGAHVDDETISRSEHLNHHNEPLTYLFSDLYCSLVTRLYALGYYDRSE